MQILQKNKLNKPCLFTWRSDKTNSVYHIFSTASQYIGPLDPLFGLRRWKKPAKSHLNIAAKYFQMFLPENMEGELTLGQAYPIPFGVPEDLPPGAAFSANRCVKQN